MAGYDLPEGFTLDAPTAPPEGFVIDVPAAAPTGSIGAKIIDAAVVRPTTSYLEGTKDIQQEGLKTAKGGLGQIVRGLLSGPRMVENTGGLPDVFGNNQPLADIGAGAAKAVGGVTNYALSPGIGAVRTIASEPAEKITGIPKQSWEAAALAALPLPKSVAVPKFLAPETAATEAIPALSSAERAAAGRLQRSIARDQMTPEHLINELATARAERPGTAALGDVGGENVAGMTERLATTPGPGVQTVIPRLNARQEQQAARLSMDLGQFTGNRRSALEATRQTIETRAQAATPLYQRAYSDGDVAIWSPELERLSSSPTVRSAMQGAVRIWRDAAIADGYGVMNPGALVDRGGQLTFLNGRVPVFPNLQFWDYTKRVIDDQISAAVRAGKNQKVRTLTSLNRALRNELDSAVPSYVEARNAWSGPQQYLDAIESGRSFLSRSAEEVRNEIADLSAANREGYVTGAVSELMRRLGSNPARYADLTRVLRAPEVRQKIAALMPDAQAAQAWERRLDLEVRMSERAAKATGNSRTAYREAMKEDDESLPVEALLSIAGGSKSGLLAKLVDRIPAKVMDAIRARSDKVLADVLTNPNSESADRILSVLAAKSRPSGSEFRIQARYPSPFAVGAAPQSQPNE